MTNEVSVEEAIDVFKIMKRQVLEDSREDKVLDIAIKALETASCIKEKCAYCPHCENCDVDDETLEIKTLEQQPCEDCISREQAKQFLYERIDRLNDDELYDIFSVIIDDMYNELPSVTPKPKSGKWIDIGATHSQCDKCLAIFEIVSANGEANYCPNCGADMRGDT